MSKPNILQKMDSESIRWQNCAICDAQNLRIVSSETRPDFALCDTCGSAFVLEDGGEMRMFYGRVSDDMPQTQIFAEREWKPYLEIRTFSARERQNMPSATDVPPELEQPDSKLLDGINAILDLEAEQTELLYDRAKKIEPPPRVLRETGELPNIDDLFKDLE